MKPLDLLSLRYGIQEKLQDVRGNERATESDTKRSLLAAMGVSACDDASAMAALQQIEEGEWDHSVPPVMVVGTDQRLSIPVISPERTTLIQWVITLEDGTQHRGESHFQNLPMVGQRDQQAHNLQKRMLEIPDSLPMGYHKFRIASRPTELSLIVTPGSCWLPEKEFPGERYWGIAAQVYLLRSEHNWGIGDFSDLSELIRISKEQGADVVGVNPLHAMFPDLPEQASPYSPSDRNLLNLLNIDIEAIKEFSSSEEVSQLATSIEFLSAVSKARDASHVTYTDPHTDG